MAIFLVTGGAGFIGSHLTDALLQAGHRVRVLDDLSTGRRANLDPRCEFILGDVADAMAVRRAAQGTAGVFHLAAIASVARSNEEWCGTHRVNAAGTVAVLDAARAVGRVPVVYASSAAIYGDQGAGAINETARPAPMTAYGADKLASELHAAIGFGIHAVPSIGFRFFNVYGPRQDPASPYSGVISIFAARIAAGLPVALHGDGRQTRDFVYVLDVVRHLVAAMALLRAAPQAAVLNLCTGHGTAIRALAQVIGETTGGAPALQPGPARPGDIRASVGDPARPAPAAAPARLPSSRRSPAPARGSRCHGRCIGSAPRP
ncbi:MAG: NAD-dependent epimerase/dehydratase family protein, partial [Acetobacteraceae bacterium]